MVTAAPRAAGEPSQIILESFGRRERVNRTGMIVLGSWALANIALGTGLLLAGEGDSAFHQMNVMWNTVNLGLAAAGLIRSTRARVPATVAAEIRAQHAIEKVLLVNTGLDVGYMAAGALLTALDMGRFAESYPGWGRSIVVQGGFLFAFDLAMTLIHRRNRSYERALE